jgi:hypothetical protein
MHLPPVIERHHHHTQERDPRRQRRARQKKSRLSDTRRRAATPISNTTAKYTKPAPSRQDSRRSQRTAHNDPPLLETRATPPNQATPHQRGCAVPAETQCHQRKGSVPAVPSRIPASRYPRVTARRGSGSLLAARSRADLIMAASPATGLLGRADVERSRDRPPIPWRRGRQGHEGHTNHAADRGDSRTGSATHGGGEPGAGRPAVHRSSWRPDHHGGYRDYRCRPQGVRSRTRQIILARISCATRQCPASLGRTKSPGDRDRAASALATTAACGAFGTAEWLRRSALGLSGIKPGWGGSGRSGGSRRPRPRRRRLPRLLGRRGPRRRLPGRSARRRVRCPVWPVTWAGLR